MYNIKYYVESFYYNFINYSPVIKIAVLLIFLFLLVIVVLIISLSINSYVEYKEARRRKLDTMCYSVLVGILTNPDPVSREELNDHVTEIEKSCSLDNQRIISTLVEIKNNNPETFNHYNLQQVVRVMNLSAYWDKVLSSRSLKKRMNSLQDIIELNATVSESVLLNLVYHKNNELRKRARAAQIALSQHDPFRFFEEDFDEDFTEWENVKIHNILLHRPVDTIPNFARWIPRAKNEDLQCLFIFEIGYYNQVESSEYLFELFRTTTSEKVKKQILETLGKLNIEKFKERLTEEYPSSSGPVQYSIIKSLERVLDPRELLPFFVDSFKKAYTTDLKLAIGNAIYNSGERGKEIIDAMKEKAEGFDVLVFNHIENPLITD